jgi:hypothetical protein
MKGVEASRNNSDRLGAQKEVESARSSPWRLPLRRSPSLTLLARLRGLKRHGVGEGGSELGADFTSLVPPSRQTPHVSLTGLSLASRQPRVV